MREIAPTFYNLGVRDSHTYVSNKLDDLFEIEKKGNFPSVGLCP